LPNGKIETVLNIKVNSDLFPAKLFRVKSHYVMQKIMSYYDENVSRCSMRFTFDGTRVKPTDTPLSLAMEDGDVVDASPLVPSTPVTPSLNGVTHPNSNS